MLPAQVTLDGAGIHEVVPASEYEARRIHFAEMARGVFLLPVLVVSGMAEHLAGQILRIARISGFRESHPSGGPASAIAEVTQAEPGVCHVLRHQVRRLGDC